MKNHAFIFSALFISSALFPLPEFLLEEKMQSGPEPRHHEEIVFDKAKNTLYLFGGVKLKDKNWQEPDDFFEYKDGWREIERKGPIGRRGHALVFDNRKNRILLVGGVAQTQSGGDSVLFDVWTYKNNEWKILETKCPVKEPRAVFDHHQNRVLVYGDSYNVTQPWSGGDERKFELWEFRADKWFKLSDNGPANGPFPLAYNEKKQALTFLEWNNSNALVIWEWRKDKWEKREFTSDFPSARSKYSFTYSAVENALLLFGGVDSKKDFLGDFWKFDGSSWSKIESPATPSARASLRMIDAGERILLYGGVTKAGLTNELWQFKNNTWTKQ